MIIVEKIVVSRISPMETNVIWLDISGKPTLKSFLAGAWTPISGDTQEMKDLLSSVEEELNKLGTKIDDLGAYTYKGSCNYEALPSSGNSIGDVWNVLDEHEGVPAGTNYAWTGNEWDALGGIVDIDLSEYTTKDEVSNSINSLKEYVDKQDQSLANSFNGQILEQGNSISALSQTFSESVNTFNQKVTEETNRAKKAEEELDSKISNLDETKASTTDLDNAKEELNESIENINAELENKANVEDLSNVLADEYLGDVEEVVGATREEIKKDLFIDLWNNACGTYGKYNKETDYFELNGITDITYDEAIQIYSYSSYCISPLKDKCNAFVKSKCRTMLPINIGTSGYACVMTNAFQDCTQLEVVKFAKGDLWGSCERLFYNCVKLREIQGEFSIKFGTPQMSGSFQNCQSLEEIRLYDIITDVSFSHCHKISYESLKFLIDKSTYHLSVKKTPKVTLNKNVYNALIGEETEYPFNGGTQEEWAQLLIDATEKNITFATT